MSTALPLTPTLSPNTKNVLGEREQIVGTLTQGGTSGSCRWCRPGLPSDAPLGLYREEAASCRFTNVQSPGPSLRLGRRWPPGEDALLRVCDGTPSTDAEHCVPTGSGLYALPMFFPAPLWESRHIWAFWPTPVTRRMAIHSKAPCWMSSMHLQHLWKSSCISQRWGGCKTSRASHACVCHCQERPPV